MTTADYEFSLSQDGLLVLNLAPPTNVSGWTIVYSMAHRQGGMALVTKSVASGLNNTSGINVTDGVHGTLQIQHFAADVSGLPQGLYPYRVTRIDSGFITPLAAGYRIGLP